MKHSIIFIITLFLICCSKGNEKSQENPLEMGLIINNPSHDAVVWMNDEPVKVAITGQGAVVPIKLIGPTGENRVYVTTKRQVNDNGAISVTIKEGTWDKPDEVIDHFYWESTEDTDRSDTFTYQQTESHLFNKSTGSTEVTITQDEARKLVVQEFHRIKAALESKDLESIGLEKSDIESIGKALGVSDFYQTVFEGEQYQVDTLCKEEDLDVIIGKTTILGYSTTGSQIFSAGPPSTNDGKMNLRFTIDTLPLGYDGENWHFGF